MFRGTGAWSSWWRAKSTANLDAYLERIAPAEYYDKLKPDFPMGCKRVAYNLGWYVAPAAEPLLSTLAPYAPTLTRPPLPPRHTTFATQARGAASTQRLARLRPHRRSHPQRAANQERWPPRLRRHHLGHRVRRLCYRRGPEPRRAWRERARAARGVGGGRGRVCVPRRGRARLPQLLHGSWSKCDLNVVGLHPWQSGKFL